MLHEAAHASLDQYLYESSEWNNAAEKDLYYISDYAAENPQREDVSESVVMWFALRFNKDLFSDNAR